MVKLPYCISFIKKQKYMEGDPWSVILTELDNSYSLNKNGDLLCLRDYHILNHELGTQALVDKLFEDLNELMETEEWIEDDG